MLLHALLIGILPFQGDSVDAVFEAIKKVNLDFESGLWESVSKPARDLIAGMLNRDISSRPSADEILSKCPITLGPFLTVYEGSYGLLTDINY